MKNKSFFLCLSLVIINVFVCRGLDINKGNSLSTNSNFYFKYFSSLKRQLSSLNNDNDLIAVNFLFDQGNNYQRVISFRYSLCCMNFIGQYYYNDGFSIIRIIDIDTFEIKKFTKLMHFVYLNKIYDAPMLDSATIKYIINNSCDLPIMFIDLKFFASEFFYVIPYLEVYQHFLLKKCNSTDLRIAMLVDYLDHNFIIDDNGCWSKDGCDP